MKTLKERRRSHNVEKKLLDCADATQMSNKKLKLRSFKSSENIQKKDGGPDRSVSNNKFSSVALN